MNPALETVRGELCRVHIPSKTTLPFVNTEPLSACLAAEQVQQSLMIAAVLQ